MTKAFQTKTLPTRYGPMTVPAADTMIGQALAVYGEWAQLEIDLLARFIRRGDTVLDVGACFGTHSLAFSHLVGAEGHVIAFEASPRNFSMLAHNCAAGRGGSIQTIFAAVAAGEGEYSISIEAEENLGASSVKTSVVEVDSIGEESKFRALSIDSLNLTEVDFIKVDVEGAESDVLSGAVETIRRCRPIIFFEVNFIQDALNAIEQLKGQDYHLFGAVEQAFNPNNFLGSTKDIFDGGKECGILAIPSCRYESLHSSIVASLLATVKTADDIAILLMNKPQYVGIDITRASAAQTLKIPTIFAGANNLNSLHQQVISLESLLLEERAKTVEARDRLSMMNDRNEVAERQINWQQAQLNRSTPELDEMKTEVIRLRTLAELGMIISRRAERFPFSIYFRTKRKYRRILRTLRGASTGAVPSEIDSLLGNAAHHENRSSSESDRHPGGYKAELLRQLEPLILPETIAELSAGDGPILSADAIFKAVREAAEGVICRGIILSFSHDHYATIAGGTQLCVKIEEQEGRSEGYVYLHAHPRPYLQSMVPASVSDQNFLRLTLNGKILGICSYSSLHSAVNSLRESGNRQYVVVHHLLGHSSEWISNIISATGRRRGWFWLHDFFTLCVSPHLLRNGISFCSASSLASSGCSICSYREARVEHQKQIKSLFEENRLTVIAPSQFVADLWNEKAELPFADFSIVPHVKLEWVPGERRLEHRSVRTRVAFIGYPSFHKGWPHFVDLVNKYRDDKKYDFFYFGVHKPDIGIRCFSVDVSNGNRTEMIKALREAEVDIVLHISPTPETFSFTTHESIASGAYVVTNAGAGNTARVIVETGRGLVLEHENDIYPAFAEGKIIQLAQESRMRRSTELCEVTFSRFTIPFLMADGN